MLTGQLPFEADTPMRMFVQHLQTAPVPPSQRTELPIPREVDELVMAFNQRTGRNLLPHDVWRLVAKIAK